MQIAIIGIVVVLVNLILIIQLRSNSKSLDKYKINLQSNIESQKQLIKKYK
jgi:hypothetical protein